MKFIYRKLCELRDMLLVAIIVVGSSPMVITTQANSYECQEDAIFFEHTAYDREECRNSYSTCTFGSGALSTGGSGASVVGSGSGSIAPDLSIKLNSILSIMQSKGFLELYQKAVQGTSIPWQLIGAIHHRESLSVDGPSNGQGIFQFYSRKQAGETFPVGPLTDEEITRQFTLLAQDLTQRYGFSGGDDSAIKNTLLRYNGSPALYKEQAQALGYAEAYEGSPYVMNLADEQRDSTKNPNWKQYLGDGGKVGPANQQIGAFVVYKFLGGASVGVCGAEGSGDIVAVAEAEFAKGILEIPQGCDKGNPSSKGTCGPEIDKYTDSHLEYWCADFVSWVYKTAGKSFTGGSSGGWRVPGVSTMKSWFMANGTLLPGTETPKPGDVIFYDWSGGGADADTNSGDHVGIVVAVEGTNVTTIEGNSNQGGQSGVFKKTRALNSNTIAAYGRMK